MSTISWRRQSQHYDWLSGYLAARRLIVVTRALMAFLTLSYIVCLLALLVGDDSPRGAIPIVMTWIACAIGVSGLLLWVWRWPTRAQSAAFALTLNTGIALACLAYPNPLAGMIGCIAFATSGAYIAFFQTPALVFYNFMVATTVAAIQAVRLAKSGHPALAGVDLWLVIEVNIALPVAIHVLVRAVAGDLLQADQDPLTNLLNRRAFNNKILGLVTTRRAVDSHLAVLVIDLDNFKAVNDTHGHAAGDQALVDVAQTLLALAEDYQAALARSGGEEFLLAVVSPTCNAECLAAQVCDAIAASPAAVTASVGTACAHVDDGTIARHRALLKELITAADSAMYDAKRRGGNQSHHHGLLHPYRDRF
ncbi:GGDEF domain-containing protein [Mycobacterium dioxanotrophicus]|uniref:GGDEF domain-containing protein n=1 Tax=Mycobacterium dioxanotrophicus TaxID=482462 RepID=A0A1Y0C4E8_9MYCO|nr:GGDEF domain-containing protein [Mycobacterium dioxanotrophicus]ART70073.1 GGDEF domain-containing protein [Mycobacterium dioxanotrophicus]